MIYHSFRHSLAELVTIIILPLICSIAQNTDPTIQKCCPTLNIHIQD